MAGLELETDKLLLEAKDVTGDYVLPNFIVHAVERCSMALRKGDVVGLVGESGCGKSTLGKLLLSYDNPPLKLISGSVTIEGQNIYDMSRRKRSREVWGTKISRIPQYSMNSLNPVIKIKTIVKDYMKSKGVAEKEGLRRAREIIEQIGLEPSILENYPFELSGGMKQRAVIMVSTLLQPRVLIADEPTTALDVSTQRQLIEFFYDLLQKEIIPSMIFISHDIATLNQLCDHFYVMYAAEIVEYGKREAIINRPFHPYTKLLIKAIPDVNPEIRKARLKDIPGFPPDLRDPPKGCCFRERCSYAMDVCRKKPSLVEAERGRLVRCWLFDK